MRYKNVDPKFLPLTESLKTTIDRVMPFWEQSIVPSVKEGRNVIVVAHGNSLRAIVKYLDNISTEGISPLT